MSMNIIPLLLCLGLVLSACAPHKQAQHEASAPPANKKQHISMAQMQPQFLYLAAQDAIKDGQHGLAIELLSALTLKDPDAIQPRFQLLELLLESANYAQATQHIAILSKHKMLKTKQREHITLAQIRLHAAQGKTVIALQSLESFLTTHPAHIPARDFQIKLLVTHKRYDEALSAINNALQAQELAEFRLLQAQLYLKKQNTMAAITSLMRVRKLAPHYDTPVLMLSSIALKEKHREQAESLLRNFLNAHPKAFRIAQALGQLLVQDKRPVEAILIYRNAIAHSGNNPDMLRNLGMLYFQHKDYAEAEVIFRQLVDLKPDDIGRFYLATSLEALQRFPEARSIYQSLEPSSSLAAEAQLRLASLDVMNNDITQAGKRLQDILQHNAKHLDALLMLSTIRLSQSKYQQLLDETESILAIPKLPPQLLFNRAVAFESLKQYEQVEIALKRLIRTSPSHAEAMNFLGYTYAIQGINLGKAEALLHRALLIKPDNGYYLDSLAWIYYKNGDFSKAITTQSKALQKVPQDAIMYEHYGDMLWQHGDIQGARQAWKKAIKLKSDNTPLIRHKIAKGLVNSP